MPTYIVPITTLPTNYYHLVAVFTYPDGHVYEGPFVNDRMPGREEGSRATEDVAPQLKLNISDLVEDESEEGKHQLKLIENLLLSTTAS